MKRAEALDQWRALTERQTPLAPTVIDGTSAFVDAILSNLTALLGEPHVTRLDLAHHRDGSVLVREVTEIDRGHKVFEKAVRGAEVRYIRLYVQGHERVSVWIEATSK